MQRKPIVVGEPSPNRVRGLVVCDLLELQSSAVQEPWLIDELEDLRGPLEEDLLRARAAASGDTSDEVLAREYELRLLRLMRAGPPGQTVNEPVRFLGPTGMVERVVRGAMVNAASTLGERAASRPQVVHSVRRIAEAAAAWARTLAECAEVVGYTFDPDFEPPERDDPGRGGRARAPQGASTRRRRG